jgi:hypothetical protein
MASERSGPPANADRTSVHGATPPWARSLAVTTAVVFLVSSGFPVVAGVAKNAAAFPNVWGMLDVGIAFVLIIMAMVVIAATQGKETGEVVDATYRAYRVLSHGIMAMIVVFFLAGDRITWINCLPGFAWRAWLLLYGLPSWLTAMGASAAIPTPGGLKG